MGQAAALPGRSKLRHTGRKGLLQVPRFWGGGKEKLGPGPLLSAGEWLREEGFPWEPGCSAGSGTRLPTRSATLRLPFSTSHPAQNQHRIEAMAWVWLVLHNQNQQRW